MDFFCLIAMWTLFNLWRVCDASDFDDQGQKHYSREMRLQLNCGSLMHVVDFVQQLSDFLLRQPDEKLGNAGKTRGRRRKQGKRGGVKLHLRKQRLTRNPLPSVIMVNVQSLRNNWMSFNGMFDSRGVLKTAASWLLRRHGSVLEDCFAWIEMQR